MKKIVLAQVQHLVERVSGRHQECRQFREVAPRLAAGVRPKPLAAMAAAKALSLPGALGRLLGLHGVRHAWKTIAWKTVSWKTI